MSDYYSTETFIAKLDAVQRNIKDFIVANNSYIDNGLVSESIEKLNESLERATVHSRNMLEHYRPNCEIMKLGAPAISYININGNVSFAEGRWLNIKLHTLLPHCRFQAPAFLGDTINRLLDDYVTKNKQLPFYENAMLIIDEHSDLKNRNALDQDNKGWKIIPNSLKTRLFPDDNQFTLGVVLISTFDDKPSCNIYVIDTSEVAEFFSWRSKNG